MTKARRTLSSLSLKVYKRLKLLFGAHWGLLMVNWSSLRTHLGVFGAHMRIKRIQILLFGAHFLGKLSNKDMANGFLIHSFLSIKLYLGVMELGN